METKKMTQKQLKEMIELRNNVKPEAELPRGFGLWSVKMQLMWLRQNQKKGIQI